MLVGSGKQKEGRDPENLRTPEGNRDGHKKLEAEARKCKVEERKGSTIACLAEARQGGLKRGQVCYMQVE